MKKVKKAIALLLAVIITLVPLSVSAAKIETNYLVLGDSIGVGAGIINPDESSYGRIVADTNGYNYTNHAVIGHSSAAMLAHIALPNVRNSIKEADIISLSIGGNDFLTNNMVKLGLEAALMKDFSTFDKIAADFYNNYCKIIKTINELNPDAVILVQTLYNPMTDIAIEDIYQQGADRLNAVYRRYLSENPGSTVIVDVAKAFKGHAEYIASDCVHPNAQGNVVIATLVLQTLKNLGLGSNTTPVINNAGVNNRFLNPFRSFIRILTDAVDAVMPNLFKVK